VDRAVMKFGLTFLFGYSRSKCMLAERKWTHWFHPVIVILLARPFPFMEWCRCRPGIVVSGDQTQGRKAVRAWMSCGQNVV